MNPLYSMIIDTPFVSVYFQIAPISYFTPNTDNNARMR